MVCIVLSSSSSRGSTSVGASKAALAGQRKSWNKMAMGQNDNPYERPQFLKKTNKLYLSIYQKIPKGYFWPTSKRWTSLGGLEVFNFQRAKNNHFKHPLGDCSRFVGSLQKQTSNEEFNDGLCWKNSRALNINPTAWESLAQNETPLNRSKQPAGKNVR